MKIPFLNVQGKISKTFFFEFRKETEKGSMEKIKSPELNFP